MFLLECLISFNNDNIIQLTASKVNHVLISFLCLFLRSTKSSDLFNDFDWFLNHVVLRITRILCVKLRDLLFIQFSVDISIFLLQHIFAWLLCLTELIDFLVPIKLNIFLLVLFLLCKICAVETYGTFAPKLLTNVSLKPFLILVIIGSLDVNVMLHAFLQ
jgi:hypothetical protein